MGKAKGKFTAGNAILLLSSLKCIYTLFEDSGMDKLSPLI